MTAAPLLIAPLLVAAEPPGAARPPEPGPDPGSVAFAADLYRAVAAGRPAGGAGEVNGGGLIFSPESVRVALAMARAGADGRTAAELDAALRPPAGGAVRTLTAALRGAVGERAGGKKIVFAAANRVWVAADLAPAPGFVRALRDGYGAGLGAAPFATDPDAARRAINGWVEVMTAGKIDRLLAPGTVTAETRLALVNALHLRAAWADDFAVSATEPEPFTTPGGGAAAVPLMRKRARLPLVVLGDGTAAVRLRFVGGRLAFTAVLPPEDIDLAAFEAGLTPDRLAALLAGGGRRDVRLFLPRFRADAALTLNDALEAVGVRRAFTDAAEFGPTTADREPLAIGLVAHAATIAVDEAGAEAAAATAVLVEPGSAPGRPDPPPPYVFRADRPFLFAVTDLPTGAVLFLGRYAGG